MRHAIVDTYIGVVVNVVDYDNDVSNAVPPGMEEPMIAVASDTAQIGWTYQNEVFTDPNRKRSFDPNWDWGQKFIDIIGRTQTGVRNVS